MPASDLAYESLRDDIIQWRLEPGTPLAEAKGLHQHHLDYGIVTMYIVGGQALACLIKRFEA